jgi:hypothetical protein
MDDEDWLADDEGNLTPEVSKRLRDLSRQEGDGAGQTMGDEILDYVLNRLGQSWGWILAGFILAWLFRGCG